MTVGIILFMNKNDEATIDWIGQMYDDEHKEMGRIVLNEGGEVCKTIGDLLDEIHRRLHRQDVDEGYEQPMMTCN